MKIKIKKIHSTLPDIEKIQIGDWIDLRVANIEKMLGYDGEELMYSEAFLKDVFQVKELDKDKLYIRSDDHVILGLGFSAKLPEGYEALLVPRSSLFKKTGLLLTNSPGVIDESYCGDGDQWMASCYATRDIAITRYDRLFQFRIQKKMPKDIEIEYVDDLGNTDRGGFGSTGQK